MYVVSCFDVKELINSVLVVVTWERETDGPVEWDQHHYIRLIVTCYIRVCERGHNNQEAEYHKDSYNELPRLVVTYKLSVNNEVGNNPERSDGARGEVSTDTRYGIVGHAGQTLSGRAVGRLA